MALRYVLLWVFLLVACGGTPPEIIEMRWRLNLQFRPRQTDALRNSNGSESLSLFIRPADDDGLKDLDSMYLINEEAGLFWALAAAQWQTFNNGSVFWIGSNQFSSGYLRQLPRGSYRVQLYDKIGEMAERALELNAPDTRALSSQVAVPPIGDELLFLLPGEVSLYFLTGYNVANEILFTDANYQSPISLRELKIRNDELEKIQLSFEFPGTNVVALLGPYLVPRLSRPREELGAAVDTSIPEDMVVP